jgi:hypothetical protein
MHRRNWAVLALVPALLSGCGVLGLSAPGSAGSGSPTTTPPTGSNWLVVAPGNATPSPIPTPGRPRPTITSGYLPPRAPAAIRTPVVMCSPNTFNFSKIGIAYATPSTTSAMVSWYNVGGYNLKQFRITAISQDLVGGRQRDVGFLVAVPGAPCGQMSATITGLDRKTGYMFSVDAVVIRKSGDGWHAATVARSHVVYTR